MSTEVHRSVTVNATQERAFDVFTGKWLSWWPLEHHIGATELADVVVEPVTGGRWYEVGTDGTECDWGAVLAWEPHGRIVLSWHLNGDWEYDPDPAHASEVEVRFVAETPDRTRVELVHRNFERHAHKPDQVRGGVGGEGGWGTILTGYAAAFV
ncbi:ATPase [Lentzea tibetensis]|uniref:ATPase n=1 Tax=Lentzea tibetensis TaxID=2591470 RepID=A0A563EM40_9PSEU|nr:ATPase [Lentzea tibetensis]